MEASVITLTSRGNTIRERIHGAPVYYGTAMQFLTVESRYIAHLLQKLLSDTKSGGMAAVATHLAEVARAAGIKSVTRSQLVLVRQERSNAGPKLEAVMAAKFHGGSVDALRAAARAWGGHHQIGDEPPASERYPTRAMAIRWAREAKLPEQAIEIIQNVALEGTDPGPTFWFGLIQAQAAAGNAPLGEPAPRPQRKRR
jgi:hypothetical protein